MSLSQSFSIDEEKALFVRLAKGDLDAFSTIFHYYNLRIYPFVLNLTKSEVLSEEIVQDIFTQLWIKRTDSINWEKPGAYLFRMASNRTFDQLRIIAREQVFIVPLDDQAYQLSDDRTEKMLDRDEALSLIKEAVATLPPQRRKVYFFFREQGLSYREIAAELGISVKTVQAHLQEANKQIKNYIRNKPGGGFALVLFLCLLADLPSLTPSSFS